MSIRPCRSRRRQSSCETCGLDLRTRTAETGRERLHRTATGIDDRPMRPKPRIATPGMTRPVHVPHRGDLFNARSRRRGARLRGYSRVAPSRQCARIRTVRNAGHLQTQRIRARVTRSIGKTYALGGGMNVEPSSVVTRTVGSMANASSRTRRLPPRGDRMSFLEVQAAEREVDAAIGAGR